MRSYLVLAALAGCGRFGFDARPLTLDSDAATDGVDGAAPPGWTSIIAGDQTTCGIYQDRAYCWGRGTNGEIGDGAMANRPSPTLVALPPGKVTALSQGEGHGCAIVDAKAYCWGNAPPGNGSTSSAMPVAVNGISTPVASISCGGGFTCTVAASAVYCWGSDSGGALGNGVSVATLLMPNLVTLPATAVSVDAGNDHVFALLTTGAVYGWGHNDGPGALCTGANTTTYESPVAALLGDALPSLAGWHACAINSGGAARCWGLGDTGELGDGLSTTSNIPRNVSGLTAGVQTIMTGGGPTDLDATCAVDSAGDVSCWGSGTFGRLGNGSTANEATPFATGLTDAVELALGFDHTCARFGDGTIRCWGRGDLGQLGNGASANSLAPVLVPLP